MSLSGVLFDFGGVVFDVHKPDEGHDVLAGHVAGLLARATGKPVARQELTPAIRATARRYHEWKASASDDPRPREVGQREYWEWTASDWPAAWRAAVTAHAHDLCRRLEQATLHRIPKPGMRQVLEWLASQGIPTAVVSNALAGCASRELARQYELESLLGPQLYSDEMGVRKPNPEFVWHACEAIGVPADQVWFVGDSPDRDVRVARRAGVQRIALIPSGPLPDDLGELGDDEPDLLVPTPADLLRALQSAHRGEHAEGAA